MMKKERLLVVLLVVLLLALLLPQSDSFNGEMAELECPDECECHYFRVNWVTDCSESNLTEIPYAELSPNVYILDLNGNYITDVEPFPPDIKMRRLQLADNLMTQVRKESFARLNYLIDADFANNKIATIDPHTFEDITGFITLEVQDNPLKSIDGPFLYSHTLLYLDISSCGLRSLNPHFFSNITALSTLDLSDNPLKSIESKEFYPLRSLETLKMNNCSLTFIEEAAFKMQLNLKMLELARNMFGPVSWSVVFAPLIRLEYLDLRNSKIRHLSEDAFNNATYLRTLILAENELGAFDVASTVGQKLTQLDTLDLSYCHLSEPLSEDAFANATKLRTLYLSGNTLFASDLLVALAPLHKLQKLSLSHCGLSVLPNTLHKFKSLIELDISHNPLNDVFVKLLAPLESLEYLNMGYSNLQYIAPTTFSKMTSMRRLILSGNDLNSLETGLFANLTHLESLELNSCGLRKPLNATVFFNNLTYTDLTELQLSGNPLKFAPSGSLFPKQLSRLRSLDLSNCNLTFLPAEAFQTTRNITHLSLSGNTFSSPNDLRFLQQLTQLETIDLRYNNLSTISSKELALNPNIKKLKLVGNPWRCDCSVADLWDWAALAKGDLGVLEGAMLAPEHITVGKTKRKKLLICNYDANKPQPAKPAPGRRPPPKQGQIITATNRTWAKYVRESGCAPLSLKRTTRSAEERLLAAANHVPNNWAPHLINTGLIYVALTTVVFFVYVFYKFQVASKRR